MAGTESHRTRGRPDTQGVRVRLGADVAIPGHSGNVHLEAGAHTLEAGAHTPEELETLCEDAGVTRDAAGLVTLFEDGGVLVTDDALARGPDEIAQLAHLLWDDDRTYIAAPRRVVQARDIALVVAERAINVMRRGSDGAWRYVIALHSFDAPTAAGVGVIEHRPRAGGDRL